ncbi:hypothetical protein TRFO_12491 [Tritrichomonas foetus]|uniref:Ubiquitin-like domain-containing protein n=1 Tax=Tritrichomonas foetus TaxID=1144522 RepID=A0A1J4L5N8_9EUKA|nr:hypothetical protein TRFO_12491 [Tritrichomonas foetus]|eukprot:OHT17324.1 hypothetical protein TRFO_12491 [Tritrichomonas foetus]
MILSQHNIEQLITGLFRVPFHKLHLTIANIKLPHNFSPFAINAAFEEPIINFNYEENSQQQIFSYSNTKKWIAIPNPDETMKELKKTVMNYFATNLRSNYEYYSFNCFRFVSIYQSPIDDNSKFSELHLPSVMPIILSVVDHDYYFQINILISNEQKTFHFHTNDTIRDMKKFLSTKYRSEISKISIFSGNNELTDNLNISHDATNLNSSQVFTAVFPKIKIKSFINLETKKTDDNYYIKIEKSYTISQAEDYIKNNYKGLNWTNIKIYFTHSQKTLKSFLEIENNQTVELYLYKTVKVKCEEIVDWEVNEKLLLHIKFSVLLDRVSRKLKKPKENIRLVSISNNEDVTNKYVIDFPNNSPLICAISTNYVLGTQSETSTQFVPHIPLEPPKKLDKKKFTPKIIKIDHNNQQNNQLSNEQPQQQTSNTYKTTNNRISEEYSGSVVNSNIRIGDNKIETTKSNSDRDNSIDISVDSETEDSDMSYGSFSDKRENSLTKQMNGKSHLNVETEEEEEACLFPYSVQIDDEPPFQIYLPDESIIHNVKEKIAELKDIDDPSIISILYAGKTLSGDLPLKVLNLDEDDILQVYISNIEDLLLMTGKALKCWNLDEYYSDYESYSE